MFFAIHILMFLFHCYSATLNIAVKTIGINQAVKLDKKLLRPILLVFHIWNDSDFGLIAFLPHFVLMKCYLESLETKFVTY